MRWGIVVWVLAVVAQCALVGCGGGDSSSSAPPPALATLSAITVSPDSAAIAVGLSRQFIATVDTVMAVSVI